MTVHVRARLEGPKTTITVQADTPHDFYVEVMKWFPPDTVCTICQKTFHEHSEEEFGKCWKQKKANLRP